MRYDLVVCLSLSTASIALAVPYELPTDSGWYQLQDSNTYETLCSTGSGLECDVPAGDYVLINHNAPVGDPDRRKIVSVGEQDDGPTIIYESKTCLSNTYREYPDSANNDTYALRPYAEVACTVQCTVGMVTGGSCIAHFTGEADSDEYLLNSRTHLSERGFSCGLTSDPGDTRPVVTNGGLYPAKFDIGLACLK